MPLRDAGAASAACSSTCTSRAPTAASSAARSTAPVAQLGRRLARECPAPGAELVFSVPDSSNSAALGFAEESGLPLRARADPQPLRRPHVHPADAGRPRREGEGEVQRGARSARGQERRDGRRLDRARHDHARTRRAWCARAGARGGAHARQLVAPITGPCYYGIDTPNREELIAANHTLEEIARRSASTRSATSRSTACSSRCRAGRTASAMRASPATIPRRRRPTRTSCDSGAAADRALTTR